LRRLEAAYGDELVVIGVHSPKFPAEAGPANVRQAVLRNAVDHPVVNDPDMAVWQQYGVNAWPTLMFVDPSGRVFATHAGEFDYDAMHRAVGQLLDAYRSEGKLRPGELVLRPEPEPESLLRFPGKVLADSPSERLFIADSGHHQVVVATMDGAITSRFGSGAAGLNDSSSESTRFTNPQGLALSPDGQTLYVTDAGNHALRSVDLATGAVVTVAGTGRRARAAKTGPGPEVDLASPWDLAWHDGRLWIAMAGMHQLWTYDPATGIAGPAAGTGAESIHDGPLAEATFAQPMGLTALAGRLYVADSESSAMRSVDPAADRVRRLVGRGLFHFGDLDARGDSVRLQHVQGVVAVPEGGETAVYLADSYNNKIKRLDPATRAVVTVAGSADHGLVDGAAEEARFWEPTGISIAANIAYIADTNNHAIRRIDLASGRVLTVIQ
jgi:DNA-binding beta-propeller fold protein YncE